MANDTVGRLKKLRAEAKVVLDESSLVGQEEQQLTRFQQFLHFWVLVGRSFLRNRCPVRASALAYASLLAMVPMLAVAISVSSSLLKKQGEEPIEQFIDKLVATVTPQVGLEMQGPALPPTQPAGGAEAEDAKYQTARRQIAHTIKEFIGNVRSGTLGVSGMIALVFVAITMLSRIENTFNDIWGVTRGRTWLARVVYYWAAIALGPLLLMAAIGLTSGPHLEATRNYMAQLPLGVGKVVSLLFRLLPFAILGVGFALFYQLMPNTKVDWRAALAGGMVGGCLWQMNNMLSVLYVSRVVTNSKIYGSLGMVPVVMIGLYFSWIILLFGAQVAYAFQNRRTYLQEKQAEGVHQRSREFVALRLMTQVGWQFNRGQKPLTLIQLAEGLGVPTRLAGQILQALIQSKLLVEALDTETAYVPARPLNQITAQDILQALRVGRGAELRTRDDPARPVVALEFERISQAEQKAGAEVTLQALVERLRQTG
jgi:membrane protein